MRNLWRGVMSGAAQQRRVQLVAGERQRAERRSLIGLLAFVRRLEHAPFKGS